MSEWESSEHGRLDLQAQPVHDGLHAIASVVWRQPEVVELTEQNGFLPLQDAGV
jgi:hypothetical protein